MGIVDSRRLILPLSLAAAVALPAPAGAVTLYDQYNNTATTSPQSQGSTKYNNNDQQVADDFVVPAGRVWSVDRVEANGDTGGFSFSGKFNVRFFNNAGTLPEETAIFTALARPLAPGGTITDVVLDLNPPIVLSAGRYWLSIQAEESGNPYQWNWRNRTVQNGYPAAFRNVGTSCSTWTQRSGGCGIPTGNPDQVFRIRGTETGPSGPGAPGADTASPFFIAKSSADPSTFAVNLAGTSETPVSGVAVKKGTTFKYSLSEAARVTFTIQRKLKGRRVKGKCRKPTRRNRRRRKCTRYTRAGAFRQLAVAGANRKPFSGKIGRKTLRPGRYRAVLVAVDAAGNRSKPATVGFRVVRARKHKRRA